MAIVAFSSVKVSWHTVTFGSDTATSSLLKLSVGNEYCALPLHVNVEGFGKSSQILTYSGIARLSKLVGHNLAH